MNSRCYCAAAALALPLLISGCSILPATRKLPVPKAPAITQTVAPEDLVNRLNQHWAALDSLTATADIQASVIKSKEGLAKVYNVHGHILMRKPGMLRLLGQYLGMRVFDLASDGKNFTLFEPTRSKAIKGSNALKKKSANQMENMRPGVFYDAMAVRGLDPDDLYSVTADTITVEDASRKHINLVQRYILSISRRKPNSHVLIRVRVVYFHRDDLEPYQQDIYDSEGNLETQVIYSAYQNFGPSRFPSKITIKRPLEELEFVLTVDNVKENQSPALTDDQFQIRIPEGTEIQQLE